VAPLFESFPVLCTERLILRRLRVEDAQALFPVFSDAETLRYWASAAHRSFDETRTMIDGILQAEADGTGIEWGVTWRGDDTVMAKVCHHRWTREHFRSEIGYIVRRDLWRRGIATEALRAILDFGFSRMALHSTEAQLDPGNVPSIRVLEGLGFVREAHLHENFFNGTRFSDTLIYSLLASAALPR